MASTLSVLLHCTLLVLILAQPTRSSTTQKPKNATAEQKPLPSSSHTYIIQTNHLAKPSQFATLERWYSSMVATHSPRAAMNSSSRLLHTYGTVMHGFAVRLTEEESRRMSSTPGVSGVYRSRMRYTQTTRSPGFMGLHEEFGAWPDSELGDGVIIGFIDSGIWPESASFNDSGLGPVRSTWKGTCVAAEGFNASSCNNKLVGAKVFAAEQDGTLTPRDKVGHGTHVSGTAAGSEVRGAQSTDRHVQGVQHGGMFRAQKGGFPYLLPRDMEITSMACPHVAGTAALIKKRHGDWTPAMVRSALMTTATPLDKNGRRILDNGVGYGSNNGVDDGTCDDATPLAAGAGLVLPRLAMDPGLVYDLGTQDYVDLLCTLNYTTEQMRRFVPGTNGCARTLPGGAANLNYPSLVAVFDNRTSARTLMRTVTKVSAQAETYNVTVAAPAGVNVTVTPTTLVFRRQNEKKSYSVEFRSNAVKPAGAWEFGHITWENRKHQVRSPVAVLWQN